MANKKLILVHLFLLTIINIPVYYKLGDLPLQKWDESGNAVNAIEMYSNHNYISRFVEDKPDFWETKPPLLIWLQVIGMKIFGINELAIRLPSALSVSLMTLLLYLFFLRLKNPAIGLMAAFILITNQGMLGIHTGRTGDHDALLSLFSLLIALLAFMVTDNEHPLKQKIFILLIWLVFTAAVLLKSVAIFMFLPGVALAIVLKGKLKLFLTEPFFYFGLVLSLAAIASYYFLHEKQTPGYFSAVLENEFLKRYANSSASAQYKSSPFYYYLNNLFGYRFVPWIYLTPFAIYFFYKKKQSVLLRELFNFILIIAVSFLTVISFGSTNVWYDAPALPLLSVLTAFGFYEIIKLIYLRIKNFNWIPKMMLWLAFAIVCIVFPFFNILKYTQRQPAYSDDGYGYYLRLNKDKLQRANNYKIYYEGYFAPSYFYAKKMKLEGYHFKNVADLHLIEPNDYVFVSQANLKDSLTLNFNWQLIDEREYCSLFLIQAKSIAY